MGLCDRAAQGASRVAYLSLRAAYESPAFKRLMGRYATRETNVDICCMLSPRRRLFGRMAARLGSTRKLLLATSKVSLRRGPPCWVSPIGAQQSLSTAISAVLSLNGLRWSRLVAGGAGRLTRNCGYDRELSSATQYRRQQGAMVYHVSC